MKKENTINKITITDRFIYNLIKSYSLNNKAFFASNDFICEKLNKSKSVVSHSINRLLKFDYIENKGNKYMRQLFIKKELLSADFSISSAENSISLKQFDELIAKSSIYEVLKTAFTSADFSISSAENSNILLSKISILLSITSKAIADNKKLEEEIKLLKDEDNNANINKKENIKVIQDNLIQDNLNSTSGFEETNALRENIKFLKNKIICLEEEIKLLKDEDNNTNLLNNTNKDNNIEIINKALSNWNEVIANKFNLSKIKDIDKQRKDKLLKVLKTVNKNDLQEAQLTFFKVIINLLENKKFYIGENNNKWKATFDFFLNDKKFTPIFEEYLTTKGSL